VNILLSVVPSTDPWPPVPHNVLKAGFLRRTNDDGIKYQECERVLRNVEQAGGRNTSLHLRNNPLPKGNGSECPTIPLQKGGVHKEHNNLKRCYFLIKTVNVRFLTVLTFLTKP